ncbi:MULTISPECIES: hypothetical protein [Brevibacillus]|nr:MULTISPECIES: hypothetical protein [Brevibacillus]
MSTQVEYGVAVFQKAKVRAERKSESVSVALLEVLAEKLNE